MKRTFVALLCLGMFVSGCAIQIGNRHPDASGGTVGQQLVDLKKAKDAGAISEGEYEAQRKKLLDNDED
jgi:hypothetical protein